VKALATLAVTFVVGLLTNMFGDAPRWKQAVVACVLCLLVFFVHWRRLIQFLFSLLNTVGRGCCSFLYNGYTRLQIFMDGGVRRSSLLNTASTADSNEIIESRF
jgi:hypothetical protein